MYEYNRTELSNGLKIVSETIPHVRSVSVGVWVAAGSRYEPDNIAGASHFLEHLLFKGTEKRTARELSLAIDSVGGQLNAFTSKEYTCFYIKVLDEHFPLAIEILSDMMLHSLLATKDIDSERGVILEEIKMYEDTPDDLVHVEFSKGLWPDSPLGRPVVGSVDTIGAVTPDQVRAYFNRLYSPTNTVIAVAGNVEHAQVLGELEKWFGDWSGTHEHPDIVSPVTHKQRSLKRKETEQAHLVVGGPGVSVADNRLYVLSVLSTILGGGSSSRLFQEVREERALVYSIYTFNSTYRDTGLFGIYAGTSPEKVDTVLQVLRDEITKLLNEGLEPGELERNKEQLKGSLMLSLESTSSRMMRLGKTELLLDRIYSPDDIVRFVDAVREDQVLELAHELLQPEGLSLALVGPIDDHTEW